MARTVKPKRTNFKGSKYIACIDLVVETEVSKQKVNTHAFIIADGAEDHDVSGMGRWYTRNGDNVKRNAVHFVRPAINAEERADTNALFSDAAYQFAQSVADATRDKISVIYVSPFVSDDGLPSVGLRKCDSVYITSFCFPPSLWDGGNYSLLISVQCSDANDTNHIAEQFEKSREETERIIRMIEAAKSEEEFIERELDLYIFWKSIVGERYLEFLIPQCVIV